MNTINLDEINNINEDDDINEYNIEKIYKKKK